MKHIDRVSPSFGLLILVTPMGSALALAGLIPILPAISKHFAEIPHVDALVRSLVTVVSVAMVLGATATGYLVERFGIRKVLMIGALLFTISGFTGFFIDNLWLLLANRLVLGLAEVTVSTTVIALIADRLQTDQRNRWIGWYTSSGAIASLLWIWLAGLVAEYNWRYTFAFFLIGLVIFASAAIAARGADERPVSSRKPAESSPRSWAGLLALLPLVAMSIAAGAVENTCLLFLPFHMAEIGEALPSRIAQVVLPVPLGVGIAALFYGRIRRHLSIAATFSLCFLSAAVLLVWLGNTRDFTTIFAIVSIYGLGIGMIAPNLYAYAAVYGSPQHRARNIGIARGCFFIGAPLMQLMLEPIANNAGSGMALVTLGCLAFVLMVITLTQGKRLAGAAS